MVGFASMMIEDIPEEKYIGWIKDNPDDYLYKYLHTAILIMILKYCMLSMEMP